MKIFSKFKRILTLFVIGISLNAYAQDTIVVFKDYASFVHKKGDVYDKMIGYSGAVAMKIGVEKDGIKAKLKCKEMWGFIYNGSLFRTDIRTGQFGKLILKGKICYYENGPAHLELIRDGKGKAEFSIGYYSYVSKNLETPLTPFPKPGAAVSDATKLIKKFRQEYPEYEDLFETIDGNRNYIDLRFIINKYNNK